MARTTYELTGIASCLAFDDDVATWTIKLPNSSIPSYCSGVYNLVALKSFNEDVWQKLQRMTSGQRIRVIAKTPDESVVPGPGVSMLVIHLELLDAPQEVAA